MSDNFTGNMGEIQDLKGLEDIPNENFVDVYIDNLEVIHRYNAQDVQECLSTRDMDYLIAVHKALCERVQGSPEGAGYIDKRPINRQVKRTILPDIFHLGFSLVNKNPLRSSTKYL